MLIILLLITLSKGDEMADKTQNFYQKLMRDSEKETAEFVKKSREKAKAKGDTASFDKQSRQVTGRERKADSLSLEKQMKESKKKIQKSKTKKSKTDFKSIEDELDAELDKM